MKRLERGVQVSLILLAAVGLFYIVNVVLLLLNWPVDSTKSVWYMTKEYFIPGTLLFCFVSLTVGFVLFSVSKIAYILILKNRASNFPKRFSIIAAILAFAILTVISIGFWVIDKSQVKSVVLKTGKFAELPRNTKDINYAKYGDLLSTTSYLSFKAHSVDIEKWIEESPGLTKVEPKLINLEDKPKWEHRASGDEVIWFKPDKIKSGKFFDMRYRKFGSILIFIDDQTGAVYIRVSHF